MDTYDLLVIGGGINGTAIAADAAARGLSVLLVEKGDLGSGTSSASSKLIHGGLRYLQYGELGLVREALHDRELLLRRRPHLVRPLELLIPVHEGGPATAVRFCSTAARQHPRQPPRAPAPRCRTSGSPLCAGQERWPALLHLAMARDAPGRDDRYSL